VRGVRAAFIFSLGSASWVNAGHGSAARVGVLAVVLAVVAVLTGFRYWARVRGVTGDFLGATEQLGELAALAVLAWMS
jgi:adenosylcobinamide-GDP ribazoletransferase